MAGVAPGEVLFISASVGGMPVYTGVRVIYADDESFTVMTPEGHPESGWNTFSAYQDDDGVTVAQIQSLSRANDPIYELGFRIVGSTEQERIWTHVLKSLTAHFGVNEPVTLEKVCVRIGDSKAYVSFDVDFVDPAFAPGTGTPEVGGFTSREAQVLVRGLENINIVGCDVVEVYPAYDPAQITAFLAANVAYELLSLIAARKRDKPAHGVSREPSVRH